MRPACLLIRGTPYPKGTAWNQCRTILTLAIETSCDDTSVAILEKQNHKSQLHFHSKITSDNRVYQGVHPIIAHESHQHNLATLVKAALQCLPVEKSLEARLGQSLLISHEEGSELRKKPDFITVTRGPGMRPSLTTGLDTAKGLAVAWQIPLLGVNHMQAHALTPRLVSSLENEGRDAIEKPEFPFLSLLVSGGHTLLIHSRGLCAHQILASTSDIAIGDVIDKCSRQILPASELDAGTNVMYGPLLESFAFPGGLEDYNYEPPATKEEMIQVKETGYNWSLRAPLSKSKSGTKTNAMEFSFSGLGSSVKRAMDSDPQMENDERRVLARETMRVAFEHLAARVLLGMSLPNLKAVQTLVVAGGVASNHYLKHVLRKVLDKRGFEHVKIIFPPPSLCTDNAAMIAWTGIEMWEAGWESELDILTSRKWSLDPDSEDGGILGATGWRKRET